MKNCYNFVKQYLINGLAFIFILNLLAVFTPANIFPQSLGTQQIISEDNVFTNGGFETGDFTGWVTQDISYPWFPLQVGGAGITPDPFFFVSDPTEGLFAALHGFDGVGPGTIRIAQDVTIHAGATSLEFDYRAGWMLDIITPTVQDKIFMVNIEPTGGGTPLQTDTILVAQGDTRNPDTGNLLGIVDVSGFANSSVRISFDWWVPEIFAGPCFFQLDDVFVSPPIPVELTAFSAVVLNGDVNLNWTTATETNNQGFEIQRRTGSKEYSKVGFVPGHGTTTDIQAYAYLDSKVASGDYTYRLKQIDFNGTYEYSDEVAIEVTAPLEYALEQNYPNPFNPSTTISYSVPEIEFVTLKVYDVLGSEITTLISEEKPAGSYEIEFDASNFSSGVYYYKLQAGSFVETKKMVLMK